MNIKINNEQEAEIMKMLKEKIEKSWKIYATKWEIAEEIMIALKEILK